MRIENEREVAGRFWRCAAQSTGRFEKKSGQTEAGREEKGENWPLSLSRFSRDESEKRKRTRKIARALSSACNTYELEERVKVCVAIHKACSDAKS
jgi:hypothetical protein